MFFLSLGPVIAAFALEGFLVPNNIIDGGIVGVSIITSFLCKQNLGLLIVLFNIPFFLFAFNQIGKKFVLQTFYSIVILSLFVNIFHGCQVTDDLLLSTVFGGIILGVGVGTVLKNDGSLDGTEIMSLVLSKKYGYSVGEIIMTINVFIYLVAGLVFGWDKAMYSVLSYFITYRVLDMVIEGFNTAKSIRVISDNAKEIGSTLMNNFQIGVTYLKGMGAYSGQDKDVIFCVVTRLELGKIKEVIKDIDPHAFVSVGDVHEVYGGKVKK
ncbi:MAG: YitT family protein [Candidatus Gastranaerophilales bacterium]